MAVHELATNAVKYGALSGDAGTVHIAWRIDAGVALGEPRFVMTWTEKDGPPVVPPRRRGFGYTVLVEMPEHLFGTNVSLSFPVTGAAWELDAPAAKVVKN